MQHFSCCIKAHVGNFPLFFFPLPASIERKFVVLTCICCMQAPQYSLSAKQQPSRSELMSLGDTLITAADDYNMLDDMILSDDPHMDGHHMGHRHKCLFRQTYRWLCHHKDVIRMALVVELILCAVFAAVHVVWSCCVNTESSGDAESNLKAPLIESASAYTTADEKMIISPLWAHVMDSKSGVSPV